MSLHLWCPCNIWKRMKKKKKVKEELAATCSSRLWKKQHLFTSFTVHQDSLLQCYWFCQGVTGHVFWHLPETDFSRIFSMNDHQLCRQNLNLQSCDGGSKMSLWKSLIVSGRSSEKSSVPNWSCTWNTCRQYCPRGSRMLSSSTDLDLARNWPL